MPIRDGRRLIGHLVEVRRISASSEALRRLADLIGGEAALLVGNRDGSLWTDFRKAVEHPAPSTTTQRYEREGRKWITATGPVYTGPWVIGVEFPEDAVLAPVYALRSQLILIGTTIVLLAVVVSERLSRRLTVPLRSLTTSAEQIAAGIRTTPVVPLERGDELGRLSRAFAAMADSVRTSHDTLEHEIGERTAELQAALTRLRDTQDELVRRERLATVGQLSGSIAHELRNPLGVMTNALYYLEAVLGDAPAKVREHLAKLRTQVHLSESIITGLLTVSRTGAPQLGTVSAATLIDEQLARANIPPTIRVERDVRSDLPDLRVDPIQVGQILMNLFTNAIQAMEGTDDGVLTVRARSAGDRVRITVADTGHGIRPENQERIFEPLFTTKARGIGLGLSVSRSLARANGGTLTLTHESEIGAVFALELPAALEARAESPERAVDSSRAAV